ncbi:caspase family protein [Lyngbya aestuarii]|uniref:caspase family protein n=1 Tax=Lyngbya aestuarii TaxID=118322 RepID=UPI00403E03DB
MVKVALLIGISEYGPGLNPLPGAIEDIEAMERVLQPSEAGGFDEVRTLSNPNPPVMRKAIENLFFGRSADDLILLFFSGYGLVDQRGKLYWATCITSRNSKTDLIKITTVPASLAQELMSNSPCKQQVIILECAFSSAFAKTMTAKEDGAVDISIPLASNGKVILSSASATKYSFEPENSDLLVYARYLLEEPEQKAATQLNEALIIVEQLHDYTCHKLQAAALIVKPDNAIPVEPQTLPVSLPLEELKQNYRQEVELWASHGEISQAGRYILNTLAQSWQLTPEECDSIEAEILKNYLEYQEKLLRYEQELQTALHSNSPLSFPNSENLSHLRQSLEIKEEDIALIEARVARQILKAASPTSQENAKNSKSTNSASEVKEEPLRESIIPLAETATPEGEATQLDFAIHSSSNPQELPTNTATVSTLPKQFLLGIGIGGSLTILALMFDLSHQVLVKPVANLTRLLLSPPQPSLINSGGINLDQGFNSKTTSSNTATSPNQKTCSVVVNGNLRSEPASFRPNLIKSVARERLPVTGKQTEGGWIEVKLDNHRLAWAHRQIISDAQDIDSCILKNGLVPEIVPDINPGF